MTYDPKEERDSRGRWGRMNSTSKASLTSKASFKTKLVGPSKNSKGRAVGTGPANVKSDERVLSHFQSNTVEKRKGGGRFQDTGRSIGSKTLRETPKELNFFANAPSPAAVAIQTAKALDKDFHNARDKQNKDSMHAALAKTNVPVIKYPSKKPKR